MKTFRLLILVSLLAGLFAFPASAQAAPANYVPLGDDTVIFGQDFTLASGDVINGSLVAFGSDVIVEEGAVVQQDIVIFGSQLDMRGHVGRDLIAVGSSVELADSASIVRDLIAPGSQWTRDTTAEIGGDIISETGPWQVELDRIFNNNGFLSDPGDFVRDFQPPAVIYQDAGSRFADSALWLLFRSFALSTLALLFVLFLPDHTERALQAVLDQPVQSAAAGFVTLAASPVVAVLMAITICLIPFSFLLFVALALAMMMGWIALGLEVGRRLMAGFNSKWTPSIQAWVGTFTLSVVVGMVAWVPCIGWLAGFLVAILGLGAVVLTRFGTQVYPLETALEALPEEIPTKKASKSKSSSKKS